jgi:hypothetical protein
MELESILILFQCFGIFYLKVTGPYWNLVTSGKVIYLDFYPHVTELKDFLKRSKDNSTEILKENERWSSRDLTDIKEVNHHERFWKSLFTVNKDNSDLLFKTVSVVVSRMTAVVKNQPVDFLEDGKYCNYTDENHKMYT